MGLRIKMLRILTKGTRTKSIIVKNLKTIKAQDVLRVLNCLRAQLWIIYCFWGRQKDEKSGGWWNRARRGGVIASKRKGEGTRLEKLEEGLLATCNYSLKLFWCSNVCMPFQQLSDTKRGKMHKVFNISIRWNEHFNSILGKHQSLCRKFSTLNHSTISLSP